MKVNRQLFFVILFFITLCSVNIGHLHGDFWIKQFPAGDKYLFPETSTGTFLSLHPEYTVFDMKGKILKQGIFKRGNTDWMEIQEVILLDDGTFFGLAYSRDESNQIIELYKIVRFTREGEVLFYKALRLDSTLFKFTRLFQVGNQVKLIGYDEPATGIGNIDLVTFSKEGEILDARRLSLKVIEGLFCTQDAAVIKTTETGFMIIKPGDIRVGGSLYKGVFLIAFNTSNELVSMKAIYHPTSVCDYFEGPMLQADPTGGYLLTMFEHTTQLDGVTVTRTPHLWKFDSEWKIVWSKTIHSAGAASWLKNAHLLPATGGLMIGLSNSVTVEGEQFSNPVLINLDSTLQVTWSKTYAYGGPGGISSLQRANNGGVLMTTDDKYFYMLDAAGEVPDQCTSLTVGSPIQDSVIQLTDTQFVEQEINTGNFFQASFPASTAEYMGFLFNYNVDDLEEEEIFCRHFTLLGTFETILERSRFSGYLVHRVEFSVDPMLAPFIAKYHIYRKYFTSPDEYELVQAVTAEYGQTNYSFEFSPFVLGKSAYDYKVVALTATDEIINYAYLSE